MLVRGLSRRAAQVLGAVRPGGNQRAPRGGKSSDGCCPFLPQLRGLSVRVFSSDVKVLECCGVVTLVVSLWRVHSCEWLEREVQG